MTSDQRYLIVQAIANVAMALDICVDSASAVPGDLDTALEFLNASLENDVNTTIGV